MHEIGHNLGLRHGGFEDLNCKPNYLSVMSYSFQFANYVGTRPLDYSRSAIGPLNEAHLNEGAGVGASTPAGLKTVYGPTALGLVIRVTGQPFDWNRNSYYYDPDVNMNINHIGTGDCTSSATSVLTGYSDWNNLKYWGLGISQPGNETSMINETSNLNDTSTMNPPIIKESLAINETLAMDNILSDFSNTTAQSDNQSERELSIQDVIESRYLLLNGINKFIQNVSDSSFVTNGSKALVLDKLKNEVEPFLGGDNQSSILNQTDSNLIIPNNSTSSGTDDSDDPPDLTLAIDGLLGVREIFDGDVGGEEADDVVRDPNISRPLIDIIDNYIAALRSQIVE